LFEIEKTLKDEVDTLYNAQSASITAAAVKGLALSLNNPAASTIIGDALRQHFEGKVDIFCSNAAAVDRTPVGDLEAMLVCNMLLSNI
jgi:hypothetical protein